MKPTEALKELGQSLWLDNISCTKLGSGAAHHQFRALGPSFKTAGAAPSSRTGTTYLVGLPHWPRR
jgi:hypothetical protein